MHRTSPLHIIFACIAAFPWSALGQSPSSSIFGEGPQSNSHRSQQNESTAATKAPVPESAAQLKAEKLVHEVFQREYADRSDQGRRILSEKLLTQAPQTEDLSERYVLLRESATAAASAGDLYATDLAIDHIAANFQTAGRGERLMAYQQLAGRRDARAGLVEACLANVDAAMSAEDFGAADQFLALSATVIKTAPPEVAARVAIIRGELASRRNLTSKVNAARETLKTRPDDREALAFVGRHYCLARADWTRGLPMLAASDDEVLNSAAQAELKVAGNPEAQLEVANRWWDLRQRFEGSERTEINRHCASLYSDVSPRLTGLRRTLAEKRLGELAETTTVPTKYERPSALTATVGSVAYLCDASGSMMGLPFDLVKSELQKAIEGLEATQSFNVCFFQKGTGVVLSEAGLLPASPANKSRASQWFQGIVVASNSDPIPSLKLLLAQHPQVLYLLSDGAFDDNAKVCTAIKRLNGDKRTRINTIAFFSPDSPANDRKVCEDVLREIASDSGGKFRVVLTTDLTR